MPSIETSTRSPGTSERGGDMKSPQPHGVPVSRTSPGSSVKLCEQNDSSSATPKIMSAVEEFCTSSPLTRVCSTSAGGSGSSSVVTITGPSGQNVSRLLPRTHWESSNCTSRAETSLQIV